MPPIRLGILGAGIMGGHVARAASALDRYEVTAVADTDLDLAGSVAHEARAAAFGGGGELLAAGVADAVYVGLPHHLHLPACLQATAAGVHGLIDKPLCNTDEEAQLMETAAGDSGTTWMVGFGYRFRAEWRRARALVADGEIGEPVAVTDVIAEAADRTPGWYWDTASGGGVLQLQSHHCFDRIAWLLGRDIRDVGCRITTLPSGAENAAYITAGLDGGTAAAIALTFGVTHPAPLQALFVLQGTRGQIVITGDRCLTLSTAGGVVTEHHDGDDWLTRELTEFADAVGRGQARTATLADGRQALRCARAAARSASSGVTVAVT
jgi:predicted dehydrogenase